MNLVKSCFVSCLLLVCADAKSLQQDQLKGTRAGCTFNLDTSSPPWPPHLISTDNQVINPVLEGSSRIITLEVGQQVTVACEGSGNYMLNTNQQLNPASCDASGSRLNVGGQSLAYSSLGCQRQCKETLRETGTCAHDNSGVLIEIGWELDSSTFINLITVCHHREGANNYYSRNKIIGKSVDADDSANQRPSFSQGGYFPGLEVNTAYTQAQQRITIANIVGSSALADKYVVIDKNYFLSRGHLAPDGDFIDAASQDASYYFLNTLPQWQSFNGGNWVGLEMNVRDLATSRDIDLDIYTGGFQVTTLADVNGVQQPIYLAFDENNNGLIPVPKYYWKVVHDPASGRATAFVGVNNPHSPITPEDVFCPDVCSQIAWSTWNNRFDIPRGYMFCCTVASLRAAIPFVPDIGDLPLLV